MNKKMGRRFWSSWNWLVLSVSVSVMLLGTSYMVAAEGQLLGGWTKCGVAVFRPSTRMWYFD